MTYSKATRFAALLVVGLIIVDELGSIGGLFYLIFLILLLPEKEDE